MPSRPLPRLDSDNRVMHRTTIKRDYELGRLGPEPKVAATADAMA